MRTSDGQISKGSGLVLVLDNHPRALMHIQSSSGPPGPVNIGMEILQEQALSRCFFSLGILGKYFLVTL